MATPNARERHCSDLSYQTILRGYRVEAGRALREGLNVMIFSDNVPLAKEVELKEQARELELLVMGPDCGTAIINGVPVAFANKINRGDIGIIGFVCVT